MIPRDCLATVWARLVHGALAVLLLGATPFVRAHDAPPSVAYIDIGRSALDLELQLPLSELGTALMLPLAQVPDKVVPVTGPMIGRYVRDHLRVNTPGGTPYALNARSMAVRHTSSAGAMGSDWLTIQVRLEAPQNVSTAKFSLDDDIIVHDVAEHQVLVYVRRDFRNGLIGEKPVAIGLLTFQHTHLEIDSSEGSWWRGFTRLFALGMHHIAEGTDHLLFLLTLLLPASMLARQGRWVRGKSIAGSAWTITKIASGFTIGHSLTLALGAVGWVEVPSRPIEVLIAVSIIVSAVHAWRPVFAHKEIWIATGFGLIHGLAFASTLKGLNFDGWTLALSLLGFNLGIESMQLMVIALLLPTLILLSRTRWYTVIRPAAAGFAAACALGWIVERALGIRNPMAPLVNWLAPPPAWFVACLFVAAAVSVAVAVVQTLRPRLTASLPAVPAGYPSRTRVASN
jgi:hypothetical protein